MKTTTNQNHKILKQQFKYEFLNTIQKLKNQNKIVLWLSWWNSLNIFYTDFVNIFSEIDLETRTKIYFCFLDERVVDFEDDDSNYKQLKNLFLNKLIEKWYINQSQILLPDFSLTEYETDYFNQVKHIDIWLFWVWPDCHTCSLFPNHALLSDTTYWYLKISDSPKPPSDRITISVNMLHDTKYAFAFFMWESKIEAYKKFMNEKISVYDCPIKLIKKCENVFVFSNIT